MIVGSSKYNIRNAEARYSTEYSTDEKFTVRVGKKRLKKLRNMWIKMKGELEYELDCKCEDL